MPATMDHLTSATLKRLRESWWDDEFTAFLTETLRPRPGNRILDVGCGAGTGELAIGGLQISQLRLFGVDRSFEKVRAGSQAIAAHNLRAGFVAGDACMLPFRDAAFDSTYCVAVLQHIRDVDVAIGELARVTAGGGRVVAVEPDNAARYCYSSAPLGRRAALVAAQFFASLSVARGDGTDPSIGPKIPGLFVRHGIEPLEVRLFPVSRTRLGVPPEDVWHERRSRLEAIVSRAATEEVKTLGREYLALFDAYRSEAASAGPAFVEIQNTMLFATVGQRL
jgi:SAM-dependent methyltransferase